MSLNLTGGAQGGNVVLSRAGGATANLSGITGAASTYTIQNVTYTNSGKLYFKATASGAATPTTDANTGNAFKALAVQQACVFVWALDASGNVKVIQGPLPVQAGTVGINGVLAAQNVDASGNIITAPQFPSIPDTLTPFAYTIAINGATGSNWTFGTSLWNATGITVNTDDVYQLPANPQLT